MQTASVPQMLQELEVVISMACKVPEPASRSKEASGSAGQTLCLHQYFASAGLAVQAIPAEADHDQTTPAAQDIHEGKLAAYVLLHARVPQWAVQSILCVKERLASGPIWP